MDSGLRVEMLAERCGLSETHFRRVFKEQTNMTPSEYVNLVRIQRACELMRKSNLAMDEVSGSVGFESTTSFNRNFKKLLNSTPYQWKKHPEKLLPTEELCREHSRCSKIIIGERKI